MMGMNGYVAGYDPGGNGNHGLAIAEYKDGACVGIDTDTMQDAESVIQRLYDVPDLLAIGVDTLVCWATGKSGCRPADLWLRQEYDEVENNVICSNSMYSSMTVNGMAVLLSLGEKWPDLHITETHPKVLYYALAHGERHDYDANRQKMYTNLTEWLGCSVNPGHPDKDHEFDAALSVYAAYKGLCGDWTHDLFGETYDDTGRLICPTGCPARYWWPE